MPCELGICRYHVLDTRAVVHSDARLESLLGLFGCTPFQIGICRLVLLLDLLDSLEVLFDLFSVVSGASRTAVREEPVGQNLQ